MILRRAPLMLSVFLLSVAIAIVRAAGFQQVTWTTAFGKHFQVNVAGDDREMLYLGCSYVGGDGRLTDVEVREVNGSELDTHSYSTPENTTRIIFKLWRRKVECRDCPNGYTMRDMVASTDWIDCRAAVGERRF